jgi:hypothetical protein
MKYVKTFESFLNEATENKAKYVWWQLYSRDNRKVESCSVTFHNKLEYNSSISRPMELHHPKLFTDESGKFQRSKLALDLGAIPPSDSFSLTCGLVKKIPDFLQFWEDEGYIMVYDEPSMNEEMFEDYIKREGLAKFAKERI